MEELEGFYQGGLARDGEAASVPSPTGSTRASAHESNGPATDTEGSVKIMSNPLELTGNAGRLGHPAPGRVLIVGARRDSRRLARSLSRGPWAGLRVVGFVDTGHPNYRGRVGRDRQLAVHPEADPVPVLGGIDRLDEL